MVSDLNDNNNDDPNHLAQQQMSFLKEFEEYTHKDPKTDYT